MEKESIQKEKINIISTLSNILKDYAKEDKKGFAYVFFIIIAFIVTTLKSNPTEYELLDICILLFFYLSFMLCIYLTKKYTKLKDINIFEFNESLIILNEMLQLTNNIYKDLEFSWFTDDEKFKIIEKTKGKTIIVVTPDASNIAKNEKFKKTIIDNMKNEKDYIYIVPKESKEVYSNFNEFKDEVESEDPDLLKNHFKIYPIEKKSFDMVAVSNVVIFMYKKNKKNFKDLYLQLRVDKSPKEKQDIDFWVKYDSDTTEAFLKSIKIFIDDAKKEGKHFLLNDYLPKN